MNAGTVQLNVDLLEEIFRREGHVLKDFEDSPVHKNKSTVAKGTWVRALNGEGVRRNSWLEIARHLRIDPPDLLLQETGATFEKIVASRSSPQAERHTSGIVVKRGALTIVIGDDFSGYTPQKQQRVWQKVYDLLGEVGHGPEASGSILVNLILDDDQVRQAALYFLNGAFSSIGATDMLFERADYFDRLSLAPYSTSRFTNLRALTSRLLREWYLSDVDLGEIALNTMESVFLRLLLAEKFHGSLLGLCNRLILNAANDFFRSKTQRVPILLSAVKLDAIVDNSAQTPIEILLNNELWEKVAAFLKRLHPPTMAAALRMRLDGVPIHEIAAELKMSNNSLQRFREAWGLLQDEVNRYVKQ